MALADEGDRLKRLREEIEDPERTLDGIGLLLETASKRAFTQGGFGGRPWAPRPNPNWPGAWADLARGQDPKARRFEEGTPGKLLVDTARLAGSFSHQRVGRDTVEAGTDVPYAGPLHEGKPSTLPAMTEAMQDRLWAFIKRQRGAPSRLGRALARHAGDPTKHMRLMASAPRVFAVAAGAPQLSWMLNKKLRGKTRQVNHPPRPMVGIPAQVHVEVLRIFGRAIGAS